MPSDPSITKELESFGIKDPSIAKDCETVSNLLSAGPEGQLVDGLKRLNAALEDQMKKAEKRAMGQILMASERTWGVNIDANGSARITALRMLEPDEFEEQFKGAKLFKDPGVSANHGEYTHRIQWYIIAMQKVVSDPVKLLNTMGDHMATPQNANGLWDCLFDRLRSTQTGSKYFLAKNFNDFRCPEYFNLWLKEQAEDYPYLAVYLDKRFKKRDDIDFESLSALGNWMDKYREKKAGIELKKLSEKRGGAVLSFSIPYALKKRQKSYANATENDMLEAIVDVEKGQISRGPY